MSMAKKKQAKKTGEALRQEAIKEGESNIAKIEAAEQSAKVSRQPSKKKVSTAKKPNAKLRVQKPADSGGKAKRVSGLDAAANVLAAFKEPMSCRDIAERAVEAGWKTDGKTPGATLHAAISREIRDKGREARFKKAGRGLFAANK